jgi:hypothetical protein
LDILLGCPIPIHEFYKFALVVMFEYSGDVVEARRHPAVLIVRTVT